MSITDQAALAVVAAGIAVAAVVCAVGRWRDGIAAGLELWVAAGLLRLASEPGFDRVASAVAIIAVRRLAGAGLRLSPLWRAGPPLQRRRPSAPGA